MDTQGSKTNIVSKLSESILEQAPNQKTTIEEVGKEVT